MKKIPEGDWTVCRFKSHDECGTKLPPCAKCGSNIVCGAFNHYCSNSECDPGSHRPCRMCGTPVGSCTC